MKVLLNNTYVGIFLVFSFMQEIWSYNFVDLINFRRLLRYLEEKT